MLQHGQSPAPHSPAKPAQPCPHTLALWLYPMPGAGAALLLPSLPGGSPHSPRPCWHPDNEPYFITHPWQNLPKSLQYLQQIKVNITSIFLGEVRVGTQHSYMNTLPVTHKLSIHCIRCLRHYTAWSVEGNLLKSVGTKFKYFPHWCLNSLLPRDCSLSLDHTIQAYPVPLDLIRLLLLGEEKGSPCSLPEEEGGRAVPMALHAPHTKQFHDYSMSSEDTQGMEKLRPALLCLKATSSCLAVPKVLFQPPGTKAATTDQNSVWKLVQSAKKPLWWEIWVAQSQATSTASKIHNWEDDPPVSTLSCRACSSILHGNNHGWSTKIVSCSNSFS